MTIRKCNHSCEYFRVIPNFEHVDLCIYGGQKHGDKVTMVEPGSDCQFGLLEQHAQSSPSCKDEGSQGLAQLQWDDEIPCKYPDNQ